MHLRTMKDLYSEELRLVCQAEREVVRVYPELGRKAEAKELRSRLKEYTERARAHVMDLEAALAQVSGGGAREKSASVAGILDEAHEVLADDVDPRVRDAAIIGLCQKIDHLEIAAYGTLVEYARLLGFRKAAGHLRQSLEEVKQANEELNGLAMGTINGRVHRN